MDIGRTSDAMKDYLSRIREASAIHSVSQQLLRLVSTVYSDGFINAAMGTLDAETVLKKGFRVGATCRISSILKGDKVDNVQFRAQDFSATCHSKAGKETLQKIWHIPEKRAEETLRVTTIHSAQTATHPLSKRYPDICSPMKFKRLKGMWYRDTFFPEDKSLHGYTCCQIFYNKFYY